MRVALLLTLMALAAGCGGERADAPPPPTAAQEEAVAGHIHGLGVDPADGALYVATHSGLFRAAKGETRAARVGESRQDTMGFTVAGPGEFLGSGHPDNPDQPPLLGLIRSRDGGRSWQPVSLSGEADFHVLRVAGRRIYGFDASSERLMVSGDGGGSWREQRPPAPLFDIAIDPADPERVVASGLHGLALSRDGGRTWRPLDPSRAGLLAWDAGGLVMVDDRGAVHRSRDARRWRRVGDVGGEPAALSLDGGALHVGLHPAEVKVSTDGGRTWRRRATL